MPRALAALFVLIALPTCMFLAVLVPPGQVADEPAHIARAAALVRGVVHGERRIVTLPSGRVLPQSGVTVDPNLWRAAFVLRPGAHGTMTSERLAEYRALAWSGTRIFAETGTIAVYFPVFYLPAALGLGAAEALRVAPYDAIVIGRIVASLCFVALGAMALATACHGRALMFCALACPMTLSLAASFNQDGLLIAAAALATALATRRVPRDGVGTAVMAGWLAAVKLPYLPLAALLLLRNETSLRRRVVTVAVVALPALLWTGVMMATVATTVDRPPYPAGPLWPGPPDTMFQGTDPLAQLRVLLAEPLRLIWLPASTMFQDPWLLWQGIGVLGWLDVPLPATIYLIWTVALAAAVLADTVAGSGSRTAAAEAAMLAGAAVLAVWGIYLSQYLTWTDVGSARVDGPSGRYFLPLVPLAGVVVSVARLPLPDMLVKLAMAIPVMAAASGLVVLPAVVVVAYYMA